MLPVVSLICGSPPRMRGKRPAVPPDPCQGRITPAHAGKTVSSSVPLLRCADHPRACGENSLHARRVHLVHGSPPRMRGKRASHRPRRWRRRITPAHAGKTLVHSGGCLPSADHPRACGENVLSSRKPEAKAGSPPRMRGKRAHYVKTLGSGRITPAHAGKTNQARARHT